MKIEGVLLTILFFLGLTTATFATFEGGNSLGDPFAPEYIMSATSDTIPLKDRDGDFINNPINNPFDLNDPSIIEKEVEYDPEADEYLINERIGGEFFRMPTSMSFDQYVDYRAQQQQNEYFRQLSGVSSSNSSSGLRDPIDDIDVKQSLVDRLFGGTDVKIEPQGNIDLTFGVDFQKVENPILPLRQQRNGGFDFDMDIQMAVTGQIGEKLNLSTNYNTGATFGTENLMKLDYNADSFSEDEIMKKIEAGNVSLPLKGSLIQGSQNLFGLKTELQFGKLFLTAVASQQRSRQQNIQIQQGGQVQEFEVFADEYDVDRHFFLTHYNRDNFEANLQNLPQINSLFRIIPNTVEVYVTNLQNQTTNTVNLVALADLGEPSVFNNPNMEPVSGGFRHPDITGTQGLPGQLVPEDSTQLNNRENYANNLLYDIINYNGGEVYEADKTVRVLRDVFNLQPGRDFKKFQGFSLPQNQFEVNYDLGIISIRKNVQPNEVVAVSFQYQYNNKIYSVGQVAGDINVDPLSDSPRFVKMLKSSVQRVDLPLWDLMMKNVYSVGAFNVNPDDFLLDIFYEDPGAGIKRFLPETNLAGTPLLRVFNLDRINVQGDPCPDGIFDFIPGVTIFPRGGKIMFPVLEPFGEGLVRDMDPEFRDKYEFSQLYDSTVFRAREYPELNRFTIKGTYKSNVSSEISLGAFNLPEGSVRVSGGGRPLVENVDYEVDYSIGRVRILNESLLEGGSPINVSFEDNTLFGFQSKTMLGLRADYKHSKNLELGATYLHLFERPFTRKVNIGDDPISNRVYGLDINYNKEAPWLTRFVDNLPLIETKAPSNVTFTAEAALLKPGHARAINTVDTTGETQKGGTVYIDDFEGSTSGYDLRNAVTTWVLASVPQDDEARNNPLFPESDFIDTTLTGVNRARLNWYRIDDFVRTTESANNPYVARIPQTEIFPSRAQPFAQGTNSAFLSTLDLTYYPDERGPYNFDLPDGTDFSAGLNTDGSLKDPKSRWAGIQRMLPNPNFENANIEFIDFWVLNPFMGSNGDNPGDLYFNIGNVSEDILRDSRRSFENGIPTDADGTGTSAVTDETSWARIPLVPPITNAFDNDPDKRIIQDVGLDGFNNEEEQAQFADIIAEYQAKLDPAAAAAMAADPSNDDFVFFNDETTFPDGSNATVLERYKRNNDPQGNSQVSQNSQRTSASTNLPDDEDINRDNSLNEEEEYFQYHIPLQPTLGADGTYELLMDPELVTDTIHQDNPESGSQKRIWYRFRIPIDQYTKSVGGIQDFRSVQFMRMYLRNFQDQVTLRFATLELTRNQWRRYLRPLVGVSGATGIPSGGDTRFEVNNVGLEENSARTPFGYVLPPGLQRERQTSPNYAVDAFQDERSMSMIVEDLGVDSMRGIFKILNLDMRVFERIEMFVHAEAIQERDPTIQDEDLSMFIRMGSDFENNFYEYEVPLYLSDPLLASTNNVTDNYANAVWLDDNFMTFSLKDLIEMKKARNASDFPLNEIYEMIDDSPENENRPTRKMRIKGNPNLGLVKGVMIGLVNRDYRELSAHSAEVWVNELRVNGLDERGGGAALARLDMQLADLGNLTLAANYSTRGWGGIEEKLIDRQREDIFQYDASLSLELGKLLPEEANVTIPMFASISETRSTPQFDPYDLDIPLKEKIAAADPADRDSLREQAQDISSIKSLNFTNVRKNRSRNNTSAPMPWDISNFKLTYAYTETDRRNPIIESDKLKSYRGVLDYNYSMNPLYISPFKKLIKRDKHLKLISELNFNVIPNSFSFSNVLDRDLQKTKYRFTDLPDQFSTFYNKRFTWDRNYALNWDLTKSLKFGFNANNRAIIDELKDFDTVNDVFRTKDQLKEEIWDNLRDFGRTKNYHHDASLNYTVPFKKIPYMDWITVKASYTASYDWAGSAIGVNGQLGIADTLGNVISNNQRRAINGNLNFESLYRKFAYLQKIDKPKKKGRSARGSGRDRGTNNRGGKDNSNESKTQSKDPGAGDRGAKGKGKLGRGKDKAQDVNNAKDKNTSKGSNAKNNNSSNKGKGKNANASSSNGGKNNKKDKKTKKKKQKKERIPTQAERILVRPLMTIRKLSLDYTEDYGTVVPGFLPTSRLLGQSQDFLSPGWDFVGGIQPDIVPGSTDDWLQRSTTKTWVSPTGESRVGWLSSNVFQTQEVQQSYSQDFQGTLKLEPFKDFRVDITANRRLEDITFVNFKDPVPDSETIFEHGPPQRSGSFSTSFFAMNTLFENDIRALFQTFADYRPIISQRLGTGVHDKDGEEYTNGFGESQSAVVIQSFLAAYTDQDPAFMEINEDPTIPLFNSLPKLNWKMSYNGLSKIEKLKNVFQSVKISHAYRSGLTLNSFVGNNNFVDGELFKSATNGNFYSRFNLPSLVISEQFSPLLGMSVRTKSGMDLNVDFKKSRNLSLVSNIGNIVLTESKATEYVIGFNYTMKDVYLAFFYGKNAKRKKGPVRGSRNDKTKDPNNQAKGKKEKGHDLNFKFDFSYRDDETVNHTLDIEADPVPTRGLKTLSISPSIDYDVNKQLNVRLFYDYRRTTPANSLSFPMTNTQGGVTIRFSLAK